MSNQIDDEVPSLAKLMKDAIEQRLCDVHVSMPARIISFDGKKASVQPLLQKKYLDGELLTLPPIQNVPVIWPQTKEATIILPLDVDSEGTLLFAERSLEKWLVAGGLVNPDDPRKFHLSDAQFIPGIKPFNAASDYDPGRIVIKYKSGKVVVGDGKIALGNADGDELLKIIEDTQTQLADTQTGIQAITVPTMMGPSGTPLNAATFASIKSAVDALKAKLTAIRDVLS